MHYNIRLHHFVCLNKLDPHILRWTVHAVIEGDTVSISLFLVYIGCLFIIRFIDDILCCTFNFNFAVLCLMNVCVLLVDVLLICIFVVLWICSDLFAVISRKRDGSSQGVNPNK